MAGIKWYGPGVGSGWCWLDPEFDWNQPNCRPRPEYVDILMQFTGLLDTNGVEIYEGDIVFSKRSGNKGQVFWHDERGYWEVDCSITDKYIQPNDDWCDYEVIGNIHENPELLGEKQ